MKFDIHQNNVFSQNGEDGIILAIVNQIPSHLLNKVAVEFGAWDGVYLSNTYNLIKNYGYQGILIESSKKKYKELVLNTSGLDTININKTVNLRGINSNSTLDHILMDTSVPKDFDLLSIDIDGADYHIWKELNDYRPKIVVIEYNPAIPRHVNFINPYDTKINQGSSARSLIDLANSLNYVLASQTHCNLIFVIKELQNFLGIDQSHNDFNLLTQSTIPETHIFATYDGQLHLSNSLNLTWHNIIISESYIFRFLPNFFQRYPGNSNKFFNLLLRIYSRFSNKVDNH
jgi:hypothetical protein